MECGASAPLDAHCYVGIPCRAASPLPEEQAMLAFEKQGGLLPWTDRWTTSCRQRSIHSSLTVARRQTIPPPHGPIRDPIPTQFSLTLFTLSGRPRVP